MLLFQIVCLLIGTILFRCVSIFRYFSSRHKLHCCRMAYYFPSDTESFFFNFKTYLESSVSFSYFSWLNDLLWLLYLSLNVVLIYYNLLI